MNVYCSSCGKPWDAYYLWHDSIFETDLRIDEAKAWDSLSSSQKLIDQFRQKFRAVGWEFGCTIINVVRCPCCSEDAIPNSDHLATKAALEQLFGDDEDGLAATFEDYRL